MDVALPPEIAERVEGGLRGGAEVRVRGLHADRHRRRRRALDRLAEAQRAGERAGLGALPRQDEQAAEDQGDLRVVRREDVGASTPRNEG